MSRLREEIESGRKIVGTHISLTDPCLCEMIGYVGFDYLWIDMEHTFIDFRMLLIHLNAAKASGTSAIVRIPVDDFVALKKVMEMGPDGVVFPMVRSVRQAEELVKATFYPPHGSRGFGPARAIRYGNDDVFDYVKYGSGQLCRFVQIEHIEAIEILDELMLIKEIDGFIFGPCDLSGSIGQLNQVFGVDTRNLIRDATVKLKRAGKLVGLSFGAYSESSVRYWHDLGIDMLSVGSDMNYIVDGARAALRNLRNVYSDSPADGVIHGGDLR